MTSFTTENIMFSFHLLSLTNISLSEMLKGIVIAGTWRDGSAVRNEYGFHRGPKFNS